MTKKFLLALIFIMAVCSSTFAAATRTPGVYTVPSTITVPAEDPDADDDEITINTIADAIEFANEYDESPENITVTLGSGYELTDETNLDASEVSGVLTITGSIPTAEDGERHYTIDGGNITFSNINFAGGNAGGGIVVNSGAVVSIDNGTRFQRNNASEMDDPRGGAIYIYDGGTVNLGNCTFTSNTANAGGAIYNAGTLNFNGTANFSSNIANGEESSSSDDEDEDDDTTSAPGYGGAVYSTKDITINGGEYSSNHAILGSALYSTGNITINGGTFKDNGTNSTITTRSGGAVYAGGTLTITGSSFSNNTATSGGAGYSVGNLTINGGSFSGNRANNSDSTTTNGGAFYSGGNIVINGGTFANNTATNSNSVETNGGAAYSVGTLNINDGSFSNNTATNGGAISATGAITIAGGSFTSNNAVLGGAVYSPSNSSLTLSGGTFTSNGSTTTQTTTDGGAIYSAANINLSAGTFTSNTADRGGAIRSTGTVTVTNGTFDKNSATGTEAFSSEDDEEINGDGGGAIYAASIVVNGNAIFTSNTADEESGSGGALCSLRTLTISDGTFGGDEQTANIAKDGGAAFAKTNVILSGGSFLYNKAGTAYEGSGGAIYAGGNITVTGGTFTANNVDGSTENHLGGALYSGSNVTLDGSILFTDNTAANGQGGAIYAVKKISNTTGLPMFEGNEAYAGGALYSPYSGTGTDYAIDMVNASFDQNSSTTTGGAVHTDGIARFTNSTFTSNHAETFGGGIFANGHVIIYECTFGGAGTTSGLGNSAESSGGAIYIQGSGSSNIQNSAFVQNSALRGGAIALSSPPTPGTDSSELHSIIVQHCYFASNTAALEGGAVRLDGYSSRVLQCTFEGNQNTLGSDSLEGGAAYLASQRILTANCTFYKNTAASSTGGALHIASAGSQSYAVVLMNTFVENKVGSGTGGGIYLNRSTGMTLFGNLMVTNTAGTNSGNDIFINTGTIRSGGYNILTDFGLMSSGRPSSFSWYISPSVTGDAELDAFDADYALSDFFYTPVTTAEASYAIGANGAYSLWVLALRPSTAESANIALGFASGVTSRQYFNNYGLDYLDGIDNSRPSANRWDTGAHQLSTNIGEGGDDEEDDTGFLTSIKISGLPATLCYVGQTTSLVVKGYDQANRLLGNVPVTWSVSPSGFVRLDDETGNIFILRATGEGQYVTITAKTANGITASTRLYVREDDETGTNLHPDQWNRVYEYNSSVKDSTLTVDTSASIAAIESSVFQSAFVELWSASGHQVSTIAVDDEFNIDNDTTTITNSDGATNSKPGIKVSLEGRSLGDMLPLVYSWRYPSDEVEKLTGTNFILSSASDSASVASTIYDLQKNFTAAFQSENGANIPVIGTNGVSFADAVNAGAFDVAEYSGSTSTGIVVSIKAYVANVNAVSNAQILTASDGTQILVVPDGVGNDGNIAGSMFLLQKVDTSAKDNQTNSSGSSKNNLDSSSGSGGGGGGGCNLNLAGALGILGLAVLIKRK